AGIQPRAVGCRRFIVPEYFAQRVQALQIDHYLQSLPGGKNLLGSLTGNGCGYGTEDGSVFGSECSSNSRMAFPSPPASEPDRSYTKSLLIPVILGEAEYGPAAVCRRSQATDTKSMIPMTATSTSRYTNMDFIIPVIGPVLACIFVGGAKQPKIVIKMVL